MKKILTVILIMSTLFLTGANVRWKDKAAHATLVSTDRMPITMDIGVSNIDKYYTPTEMATYVWLTGGTLGAKLTAGATEIEGSNFDINGGTIDDVIIGIGSACTELQVDNININGNTISSKDANGDITLTPNGTGEVVIAASDLNYAGTAITATGTELNYVDGVKSILAGTDQGLAQYAVTGITANTTITKSGHYSFDTSGGALNVTLPGINPGNSYEIIIYLTTAGNDLTIVDNAGDSGFVKNDGTITGAGSSATLNVADQFIYLKANAGSAGRWMVMGGYAYTLA